MIKVEVTQDICSFKTYVIGRLTARNLICLVIGAAYSIPIAMMLPLELNMKIYIGIALMVPAGICGWKDVYGIPIYKYALFLINDMLHSTKRRRYATRDEIIDEMEQHKKYHIETAKKAEQKFEKKRKKRKKSKQEEPDLKGYV